jgi:hypothetical protein
MTETVKLHDLVGDFAENKDFAKRVRVKNIIPALSLDEEIVLDFANISGATQSFIHALISDPIRIFREKAFDLMIFANANDEVREVISVVYRYMQESLDSEGGEK